MILGIGCVVVIGLLSYCGYKINQAVGTLNKAGFDATMMVGVADEKAVRENAVEATIDEVIADPAKYTGFICIESEIVLLTDMEHNAINNPAQAVPGKFVYWLRGPVAVMDTSDQPPKGGKGDRVKVYGKSISIDLNEFSQDKAIKQMVQQLQTTPGDEITIIIAKCVDPA